MSEPSFGSRPNIPKPTKYTQFKKPGFVKPSTYNLSMSGTVKSMIPTRTKVKQVSIPKRKSDKLITLKTHDIVGPGKHADDTLVILEEENNIAGTLFQ